MTLSVDGQMRSAAHLRELHNRWPGVTTVADAQEARSAGESPRRLDLDDFLIVGLAAQVTRRVEIRDCACGLHSWLIEDGDDSRIGACPWCPVQQKAVA